MVRKRLKEIPAVFIIAALLFVSIFSCVGIAGAASSFTPRLEAPSSDNEYYYSSKNIFYSSGYGMPNCTAYAYGRAYEILGEKPDLCTGNASGWYDYNKSNSIYSYGQTPKLGAIACWTSSSGGHVAVVEKIENGTITFSNSAWGYLSFYLTTASTDAENPGQSGWTFQGYIYIGEFAESSSSTESTTAAVVESTALSLDDTEASDYSTGVYTVSASSLNVRSSAGTGSSIVGTLTFGDIIEVTQIKTSGGYVWGYTGSGWVALDYCYYLYESAASYESSVYTAEYELSDLSGDGLIDINDVTVLQKYLAGLSSSSNVSKLGDINGDGLIDINDVTAIQSCLANV